MQSAASDLGDKKKTAVQKNEVMVGLKAAEEKLKDKELEKEEPALPVDKKQAVKISFSSAKKAATSPISVQLKAQVRVTSCNNMHVK